MRNVALVVGSLRKQSFTRKIANAIVELAPSSLRFEPVEIGNLPLYNQDLDHEAPPQPWVDLRNRVRGLDGVLFATPEYNRSVPGVLKNAIDVGSRPYGKSVWAGKPCAVISVSGSSIGAFGANHHLRQSLVFLDMPCMQQPEAYISKVTELLDDEGKIKVDSTRHFLHSFAIAFAEWVEHLAPAHASAA
ncbi:MAG TPA: NAD(P)H-dependent oxidoreductase [Kofleriaceae bacterium]|jgi:chromate reductase|nr:NAD(P)H-dependent oxidoreductase [Kofleriaceae bacterium]